MGFARGTTNKIGLVLDYSNEFREEINNIKIKYWQIFLRCLDVRFGNDFMQFKIIKFSKSVKPHGKEHLRFESYPNHTSFKMPYSKLDKHKPLNTIWNRESAEVNHIGLTLFFTSKTRKVFDLLSQSYCSVVWCLERKLLIPTSISKHRLLLRGHILANVTLELKYPTDSRQYGHPTYAFL